MSCYDHWKTTEPDPTAGLGGPCDWCSRTGELFPYWPERGGKVLICDSCCDDLENRSDQP